MLCFYTLIKKARLLLLIEKTLETGKRNFCQVAYLKPNVQDAYTHMHSRLKKWKFKKRTTIRVVVLQVQEVVYLPYLPNSQHLCSTTNAFNMEQETKDFPPAVKLIEYAERESQVELFPYILKQFQESWMKIIISRTQPQHTHEAAEEHFCEVGWAASCGDLFNNWDLFLFG